MPLTFETVDAQLDKELAQYEQVLTPAAFKQLNYAVNATIRKNAYRAAKEGRPLQPDDVPRGQEVHYLFINHVLNHRELAAG